MPRSPSRPLAALSHPCLDRQTSGCPARRSSPRQSPGNTLLRRGTRVDSDCLVNVEHLLSGTVRSVALAVACSIDICMSHRSHKSTRPGEVGRSISSNSSNHTSQSFQSLHAHLDQTSGTDCFSPTHPQRLHKNHGVSILSCAPQNGLNEQQRILCAL